MLTVARVQSGAQTVYVLWHRAISGGFDDISNPLRGGKFETVLRKMHTDNPNERATIFLISDTPSVFLGVTVMGPSISDFLIEDIVSATRSDNPATSSYLNRRLRDLNEARKEIIDGRLSLGGFSEAVLRDIKVKMADEHP